MFDYGKPEWELEKQFYLPPTFHLGDTAHREPRAFSIKLVQPSQPWVSNFQPHGLPAAALYRPLHPTVLRGRPGRPLSIGRRRGIWQGAHSSQDVYYLSISQIPEGCVALSIPLFSWRLDDGLFWGFCVPRNPVPACPSWWIPSPIAMSQQTAMV